MVAMCRWWQSDVISVRHEFRTEDTMAESEYVFYFVYVFYLD